MSIFMISPKAEESKVDAVPVLVSNDAKGAIVEKNVDVNSTTEYFKPKELDESSIIVDGPLSQIYSQALNQIYAKDGYESNEIVGEINQIGKGGRYLYAVEGEHLETEDYLTAFESFRIACESAKETFVCVEHHMNITPRVAAFMTYARECGAVVLLNREHALQYFSEKAKS